MTRNKEAAKLIKAIRKAGGEVEQRGVGQLKVTGPDGSAFVGDSVTAGRAWKETVSKIERYTGLRL